MDYRINKYSNKQASAKSRSFSRSVSMVHAVVTDVGDGKCVCNIEGFITNGIRIPASYWPSKDGVTGGISYPPVGTSVVILYPGEDVNAGFIMPDINDFNNEDVKSEVFSGGDTKLLPGGWKFEFDQEKGVFTLTNGDNFSLIADPDAETIELVDFNENKIIGNDTKLRMQSGDGYIEINKSDGQVNLNGHLTVDV